MGIVFEEIFINKDTERNIDPNYLKNNKFSSRLIFGPFRMEDLVYFDEIAGGTLDSLYNLHHAQWRHAEEVLTVESIEELYEETRRHVLEDMIIEYVGKNFFIWDVASEAYVIFGDKEIICQITAPEYDVEETKKIIESLKGKSSEKLKELLFEFYETYIT